MDHLTVADTEELRRWLAQHHRSSAGVWLAVTKKGGTITSLTWQEAVDEALCVGWIDGQARSRDDATYSIRYTPRSPRSRWSHRNVQNYTRLDETGQIQDSGRAAAALAQQDGRWAAAYAPQSEAELPADLAAAIAANPSAQTMFDVLNRTNRFAMITRLDSVVRADTRTRWINHYVDMLARHETPVPQKKRPPGPPPESES